MKKQPKIGLENRVATMEALILAESPAGRTDKSRLLLIGEVLDQVTDKDEEIAIPAP